MLVGALLTSALSAALSIPQSEYDALYDLFQSTNGSQWTWRTPYSSYGYPWNFTSSYTTSTSTTSSSYRSIFTPISSTSSSTFNNAEISHFDDAIIGSHHLSVDFQTQTQTAGEGGNPCSTSFPWQGVTCSNDLTSMFVTGLNLSYYNMAGTLPASLGSLNKLQTLFLSNNSLVGTIPSSIGNISCLQYLEVDSNQLSGTIPSTLGNLTDIIVLDLVSNRFHGTIPSSLGSLIKMLYFLFDNNMISGSIPSWVGDLKLVYLSGAFNKLQGTIPESLGNLRNLTTILFYNNQLEGQLPSSLGNLRRLQVLNFQNNYLDGTIPSSFGNFIELYQLVLCYNNIKGTIPFELGNLKRLQLLHLSDNLLEGTVPSSLGNITSLLDMYLHYNELTGSIPPTLGNLTNLVELWLYNNNLIGSIPSSFGNLRNLQTMYIFFNFLEGAIPSTLGNLKVLQALVANNNQLTGTIPAVLDDLTLLQSIDVSNNQLEGTIPFSFSNLVLVDVSFNYLYGTISDSIGPAMEQLVLSDNLLEGEIPSLLISGSNKLSVFQFSNNYISGTIPSSLGHLTALEYFSASNNSLSGSLSFDSVISDNVFPNIILFDISSNHLTGNIDFMSMFGGNLEILYLNANEFTGTIPSSTFKSTSLQSIILSSNCFSGTLPLQAICLLSGLQTLILDGLHSAAHCATRAISFMPYSGLIARNSVHGTISQCLFQLPHLSVLHLGGNSLDGSIPNVALPASLVELILSNNQLTGSISAFVWHSNITSLDLSFNRLQGTLPSDMLQNLNYNGSVKLQVNELSGTVPSVLWHVDSINILEGNLFSCNYARDDIPEHDPNYSSYSCGSQNMNDSLTTFCVALGLAIMLSWIVRSQLMKWKNMFAVNVSRLEVKVLLNKIDRTVLTLTSYILIFGMTIYGTLKVFFSTYTFTYIWMVSSIYMSGLTPSLIVFFMLCGLICIVIYSCLPRSANNVTIFHSDQQQRESTTPFTETTNGQWKHELWSSLLIMCNIVVVLTVNGSYVYATQKDYSSIELMFISLMLSLFKIVWNYLVLGGWESKRLQKFETKLTDRAMIGLCLFNNLLAPFLAEAFVSSDCFLYIISQAPKVLFSYNEILCAVYAYPGAAAFDCQLGQGTAGLVELSITPFFHYSYQCSFSLLSTYIYVFVFRYVLTGIIEPVLLWSIKSLEFVETMPPVFRALQLRLIPTLWKLDVCGDANRFEQSLAQVEHNMSKVGKLKRTIIMRYVTDFSMLITFGALCPLLTIVIAVSMLKDSWDLRLALGRFYHICDKETANNSLTATRLQVLRDKIEMELISSEKLLWDGVWYGTCVAVWIWSFVLLDILAVQIGVLNSFCIVVPMILAPYLLRFAISNAPIVRRKFLNSTGPKTFENPEEVTNAML